MTSLSPEGNLCLIPARGGSKRIPRKNLRPLAGRPLLVHAIDLAREVGLFEQIVVSSEDAEILALATQSGAVADQRPESLGADRARVLDVATEYLSRLPERWPLVMILQPPAPFRTVEDLRGAWQKLSDSGGFVVSVTEYECSPDLALEVEADGRATPRRPELYAGSTQSQLLRRAWHPNGAIYAFETAKFLAAHSFYGEPLHAWVMPRERSLDLDEPHQWEIAEAMLRCRK